MRPNVFCYCFAQTCTDFRMQAGACGFESQCGALTQAALTLAQVWVRCDIRRHVRFFCCLPETCLATLIYLARNRGVQSQEFDQEPVLTPESSELAAWSHEKFERFGAGLCSGSHFLRSFWEDHCSGKQQVWPFADRSTQEVRVIVSGLHWVVWAVEPLVLMEGKWEATSFTTKPPIQTTN